MKLTRAFMLDRMTQRDAAWDGRFIVGVMTTGIYCLPSCAARNPKPDNVRFYFSEASAKSAGLRPCMRCRPEAFYRDLDPDWAILDALIQRFDEKPEDFSTSTALVKASGLGSSKVHQLFRRHFHCTPAAWLTRRRMRHAGDMLAEQGMSVLDTARALNLESSTFHDQFKRQMWMTPGKYARLGASFSVSLPGGYRIGATLAHWGREGQAPDMRVVDRAAVKAMLLSDNPHRLSMQFRGDTLQVLVTGPCSGDQPTLRQAHRAVLAMLGNDSDVRGFETRAHGDSDLVRLIQKRPGLHLPQTVSPYEGLIWVIAGQQVNLAFAYALRRDLILKAGVDAGDGFIAHPSPDRVAALQPSDLAAMRFSGRKTEYILGLSTALAKGHLHLDDLADEGAVRAEHRLLKQRGLGPWSARYLLMRAYGFGDVVPIGDAGLVRALQSFFDLDKRPSREESVALMTAFAPHRSLATYHLWAGLEDGWD